MTIESSPSQRNAVIPDQSNLWMIGIWSLTLLFAFLLSLPLKVSIDMLIHPNHPPDIKAWLSPFLFAGIELAILAAALYVTLLHRKYGAARLELSASPAAIGGCLAGTIITGKPIEFVSEIHLQFTCTEVKGYRGNGSIEHFHQEQLLSPTIPKDDQACQIPVYFKIPSNCPPANSPKKLIRWRLTLSSPMPGVDFHTTFLIPVLKVPQEPVADLATPYRVTHAASPSPKGRGISHHTDDAGVIHLSFAAARHPLVALQYTLFALIFAAAPVALYYHYHASLTMIIPFAIILGLIALIVGISAWGMWFSHSKVTVRDQSLDLTRGQFFFSRTLHFDASDIKHISTTKTREDNTASWYCLEMQTHKKSHKYVTIADGLPRPTADSCARELKKALKI